MLSAMFVAGGVSILSLTCGSFLESHGHLGAPFSNFCGKKMQENAVLE